MGKKVRLIPAFGLFLILFCPSSPAFPQSLSPDHFSSVCFLVNEAIRNGQTPGAVVIVGDQERVRFRGAFGFLRTEANKVPMTPETVFDLASLTKVVATTPALLQLIENGKISLDDPVVKFWPEFREKNKAAITVRHLLTHYSGLAPGLPMKKGWSGIEGARKKILMEKPGYPPGSHFIYSDLNFLILGELIRRVSGRTLDSYCRANIFEPLGMKDTCFNPPPHLYPRLAPTRNNHIGLVHDPLAQRVGSPTGHAGLFSTGDDLALFARALLNGGRWNNAEILRPLTVEKMVLAQSPPERTPLRGLGWEIHSPSAGNWSEALPPGSYGHKGFTGTLFWIDPVSKTYLIVLTNRVYLSENPQKEKLRSELFSFLAEATGRAVAPAATGVSAVAQAPRMKVQTGIDVLSAQDLAPLKGLKVGLITNHSGIDARGRRTIDLLHAGKKIKLKAIFSPEHGLSGKSDSKISSGKDRLTKLPVYSLYGETLRPTPKMLKGLDALVFDIQDSGARFYTYISTMGYAMEAASKKKIAFYVLDRPNPITASTVQGPVLDRDLRSFTGYFPLPLRHGMTVGELAKMFNEENRIGAKLQVVPMKGYRRCDWFDETGLAWVNPSPNLRSLTQTALYPGVAMAEGSNVSVGRGTESPFEVLGAPWIQGKQLSDYLNSRGIPGVEFQPAGFTPAENPYRGQACYGVRLLLTDRQVLDAALLGVEILSALYRLYPNEFQIDKNVTLIGSRQVLQAIKEGLDPQEIAQYWQQSLEQFRTMRAKYLIYPE